MFRSQPPGSRHPGNRSGIGRALLTALLLPAMVIMGSHTAEARQGSGSPPAAGAGTGEEDAAPSLPIAVIMAAMPDRSPRTFTTTVITRTTGLNGPWGMALLPDERLLVTQKSGALAILDTEGSTLVAAVGGLPTVASGGQGGLLDIAIDPDFQDDPWVYWTFAEPGTGSEAGLYGTAVARGRLGATALSDVEVIFRQSPKFSGTGHYGSRLAFGADKTLFVTLGDRRQTSQVQNTATGIGKVVRIHRDGSVPAGNPQIGGQVSALWSLGHRNPQGAAVHPVTGELWISEHGPQGGDEINRVLPGGNYGWPVVSYGCNYGDPIGTACQLGGGTHAPTYLEPVSTWVPTSTAPGGIAFYSASRFPGWQGNLFVSALAGRALWRITLSGNQEIAREALLGELNERIRDVAQGPGGELFLLTDSGKLLEVDVVFDDEN